MVTALSDEPGACGPHGLVPDVVRQQASWQDCDVFVSGPPGMVRATLRALAHRASGEHLYCDPYDQAETAAAGLTTAENGRAQSLPLTQTFRHFGTQAPSWTS